MLAGSRILITGCNRGLGLEMVNQLVHRPNPPRLVLACCRSLEASLSCSLLQMMAERHSDRVKILTLDVNKIEDFDRLMEQVKAESSELDILINNAGVSPKSTRINSVTVEQMQSTLHTNTIAPLLLSKALLPLLKKQDSTDRPSLIVNISSILGSIEDNTKQGGLYPYRSSKAALNAITRSLSIDLAHQYIHAVSIHPGWVKTDMGGSSAPLTTQDSILGLLKVVDAFNPKQNGNFYDFTGKQLPW